MKRAFWSAFLLFVLMNGAASAAPFEDTVRILEDRTAFHWGRDCFVWVVHYSELLVDPWVEAEAGRLGMSESERASYRNSFISDLSMGQAEPVLVTVHAFGARPVELAPFSDKIALVTAEGKRVKPARYDRIFDQPLSGVVQGLVFFPKQSDQNFAVAIGGLGVYDERIFAFSGGAPGYEPQEPQPKDDEPEIIVVDLPPAPKPTPAPRPQPRRADPPPAPVPPPPPVPPVTAPPPEPDIVVLEPENKPEPEQVAYSSREQTLRTFLNHWINSDIDAMYSMLAESSKKLFSRQAFETAVKQAWEFRNGIRDGYTIDWTGPEQGKVVVIRRFLFIRTLVNRTFGMIREDSVWKVVW